ncbi:hypothetical protein RCV-Z2_ORF34 [Rana catesbeiana virus 2]|uniref:Uncharacterized protein n=1 Tax=Frog virus 3 TaxID=10493 RepID=A0A2U7M3J0_FRG3V|nr:hypothetical protein FV3_ORF17 [Frog virus 3]ASU44162.1 hypothetical protein RCV-Z2_ORF34 [Rana catesbeiana virus 2]
METMSDYSKEVSEALSALRGELGALSAAISNTVRAGSYSAPAAKDCKAGHCDSKAVLKSLSRSARDLDSAVEAVSSNCEWASSGYGKQIARALRDDAVRVKREVESTRDAVDVVTPSCCVQGLAEEAGKLSEMAAVYRCMATVFETADSHGVREMLAKVDGLKQTMSGFKRLLGKTAEIDGLSDSVIRLGRSIGEVLPATEGKAMRDLVKQCERLNGLVVDGSRKVEEQCSKLRDMASQSYVVADLASQYDVLGGKAQEALSASDALEQAAAVALRAKAAADAVAKSLDSLDVKKLDRLLEQASAVSGLLAKKNDLDAVVTSLAGLEALVAKKDELYKICAAVNSVDKSKLELLNVKPDRLKSLTEQTVVVSQMTTALATFNEDKLDSVLGKYMQMHRFLGMATQLKLMSDSLAEFQPAKMAQMAAAASQLKDFLTDQTVSRLEKVSAVVDATDVTKYASAFSDGGMVSDMTKAYETVKAFAAVVNSLDSKKLKLVAECAKK